MQISGGKFKGFKIKVPRDIRPTSSFNRKRMFDIIGDVRGLKVLDLFSGSGALGIEALSRGASMCVFVDIRDKSVKVIKENLKKLGLESVCVVIKDDFENFCKVANEKFDLIFADPPYKWGNYTLILECVRKLLYGGGVFILEISSRVKPPEGEGMELFKYVKGGDSALVFYKNQP